jgi:hypothetical protein
MFGKTEISSNLLRKFPKLQLSSCQIDVDTCVYHRHVYVVYTSIKT